MKLRLRKGPLPSFISPALALFSDRRKKSAAHLCTGLLLPRRDRKLLPRDCCWPASGRGLGTLWRVHGEPSDLPLGLEKDARSRLPSFHPGALCQGCLLRLQAPGRFIPSCERRLLQEASGLTGFPLREGYWTCSPAQSPWKSAWRA